MAEELLKQIECMGILPVIKLNNAKDAVPLAKALCEGGLPCAEVTFRTDAARESIAEMTKAYPEMLVGAGTVLNTEQVDAAIEAGAKFIVSPGLNPDTVEYCVKKGIPILPGCSSPSDIEQAIKYGLNVVKFFPAEAAGGLKAIKAMAAPYSQIRFMPTGGINPSNVSDYLAEDKILACGGTWMVPAAEIEAGNFDKIRELTEEAVRSMLGFRLAHVGINCENELEAHLVAGAFDTMFGFAPNENPSSIFSAGYVETMKKPYLGTKGHIAIATYSVELAKAYLERKGVKFNEDSTVYRPDGKIQAVYMAEEVGGFAIHLVRKPKEIGTSLVTYDDVYRTGIQLKNRVTDGSDPYAPYYRKGSAASHITVSEVDAIDLTDVELVHVTGIPPSLSQSARKATFRLMDRAKEAGIFITFDPNLRQVLWEDEETMCTVLNQLAAKADVVLPGIGECKILAGTEDKKEAADFYQKLGVKTVIIKDGSKGAYVQTADENYDVAGYKVEKVVDTVGAGDGFAVGVLSGILEGLDLKDSVKRGNAIGAIQVMNIGDNEGLPTPKELKAFQESN